MKNVAAKVMIAVLCLSFVFSFGCSMKPKSPGEIIENSKYVIHGAGELYGRHRDGYDIFFFGSNSLEGLERCGEALVNGGLVELDFNFTSDGELVCIHDWDPEYISGIPDEIPLSYSDFKNSKIFWQYTPIGLRDVVEFMKKNPNICIVTDIKEENIRGARTIKETCPELMDRFIIQIYNRSEYEEISALGFDKIIYTLYMLPWSEKTDTAALGEFAKSHPLVGFAFSHELCSVEGFLPGMLDTGVDLYIHTVNDEAEQEQYFAKGIKGIFTDIIQ